MYTSATYFVSASLGQKKKKKKDGNEFHEFNSNVRIPTVEESYLERCMLGN